MLREQIASVRERIAQACARVGRDPATVTLVAVTKGVPAERIREAVALGLTELGENRVQEARAKRQALGTLPVRWHLIGHLQRNKAKPAAELFDTVHSVDSSALVGALDEAAADARPLEVFVQVNVSGEATKHGCRPEEAAALVQAVRQSTRLRLRGFMTMAPFTSDPERARPHFRRLRRLRDDIAQDSSLSMGMSQDFEVAIEEGADVVRIGTAIFGERIQP